MTIIAIQLQADGDHYHDHQPEEHPGERQTGTQEISLRRDHRKHEDTMKTMEKLLTG